MLLGGGLCGLINYGHDICGFAGGRPSKELFVRWIQHGVFQPRFRYENVHHSLTRSHSYNSYNAQYPFMQ